MVDLQNLRLTVVKGLKAYLNCPVIRANQNAEPPAYPFISYTITTPMSANNGTYGEYGDNIARKPITTTWSITAQSDDSLESITLANKAREWFEYAGTVYLNDNNVIVQSTTSVSNRDNLISVGYVYQNGFDVFFWGFDEVESYSTETIKTMEMDEDWNARLEARLDGINYYGLTGETGGDDELIALLADRLNGVE